MKIQHKRHVIPSDIKSQIKRICDDNKKETKSTLLYELNCFFKRRSDIQLHNIDCTDLYKHDTLRINFKLYSGQSFLCVLQLKYAL